MSQGYEDSIREAMQKVYWQVCKLGYEYSIEGNASLTGKSVSYGYEYSIEGKSRGLMAGL